MAMQPQAWQQWLRNSEDGSQIYMDGSGKLDNLQDPNDGCNQGIEFGKEDVPTLVKEEIAFDLDLPPNCTTKHFLLMHT